MAYIVVMTDDFSSEHRCFGPYATAAIAAKAMHLSIEYVVYADGRRMQDVVYWASSKDDGARLLDENGKKWIEWFVASLDLNVTE